MPGVPSAQMIDIEIQVHGIVAAGGSSSKFADFVFHFARQNPALALPTKGQIDSAFQTAVVIPMGAALNARYLQSRNSIRYLNDAQDALVDFSHNVVGAISGDSMSTVVAAFHLGRTGLRGGSYKAKKHWFPISESDTTSGADDILNGTAVTRFTTLGAAWLAGFTDASGNVWLPTCFSREKSFIKSNPTTVVNTVITSVALNKRLGTMKHRRVASDY